MHQTSPQWTRRRNRRGVSLIEILVVLAILVVGILAIIRLFPSGFFSIESVGNTALADTIGSAALDTQAQNATGLPGAILANTLQYSQNDSSDYDPNVEPDFSKTLDQSRTVQDETVTVPSPKSANPFKCIYTVSYGPFRYGAYRLSGEDVNSPTTNPTINSPYWQSVSGTSVATLSAPSVPQADLQDDQIPRQERFLVDYANGKIAVPYAKTYPQSFVLLVVGNDGLLYHLAPVLPRSGTTTPVDPADPNKAQDLTTRGYYPDTDKFYNGGWFMPTDPALKYDTVSKPPPAPWKQVMLYRPYAYEPSAGTDAATFATANGDAYPDDPYQYTLASPDVLDGSATPVATANLGAIAFNPLAAGDQGIKPLQARISYLSYSWRVLHEDRDIPSVSIGNNTVTRLTLKNLKKVGDHQSDNMIFLGLIAEAATKAQKDVYLLDLDTGMLVGVVPDGKGGFTPAAFINDEDTAGASNDPAVVNVSYATGRLTFNSNAFQDNPSPLPTVQPKAHHVRIFYAGDQDWTVAVQKAPDFYTRDPDVTTTDPMIDAAQYAFGLDTVTPYLYFPRCDAGKTVEVDGLVAYDNSTPQKAVVCPTVTVAIDNVAVDVGGTKYVRVNLGSTIANAITSAPGNTNASTLGATGGGPGGSPVSITAVRGLSARAVVAWTERGRWKVHVVDTVLSRPQ